MKNNKYKNFYSYFPYLDIKELIEYYSVFDGYDALETLQKYESVFENIEYNIIHKYQELKKHFTLSQNLQEQSNIEIMLHKLSIGDRKSYSVFKNINISQMKGRVIYKKLFENMFIEKEFSREEPIRINPKQQIKKELRKYQIEDKIKFSKQFFRFWFTFIAPNTKDLNNFEYNKVMEIIKNNFDKYVSITFEELSNDLIYHTYKDRKIIEIGSYWDKYIEIDLLAKTETNHLIAGECKWKNQKICKNILNKLHKKCEIRGFQIDKFALFSKSGFSNELLKQSDRDLLLFDLNSFKKLYEGLPNDRYNNTS